MNTTTSSLNSAVQQSFSYKLLAVETPDLIHALPAFQQRMPANGGQVLRMMRYNRLPTAKVPLGNQGQNPPATPLNAIFIDAKMSFYGQYIALQEQVTLNTFEASIN